MIARMAPCKQDGCVRVKGVTRPRRGVADHTSPHHVAPRWPFRRPSRHNGAAWCSEAARMRTGALVRRHRVATFVLARARRLAAAVPMATWAAGRRTAVAVDQFVSRLRPARRADRLLPGGRRAGVAGRAPDVQRVRPVGPSWSRSARCPGCAHAARASWTMMLARDAASTGRAAPATMIQVDGADVPTWSGEPVVVAGRLPDRDAPDELLVSDGSAAALGIEPGSQHLGAAASRTGRRRSPRRSSASCARSASWCPSAATRRWPRATRCSTPVRPGRRPTATTSCRASNSVGVFLDGRTPRQFIAELVERLPGRLFNATPPVDSELIDTARQATGYESSAAAGVAVARRARRSLPRRPGRGPPVPARVRRSRTCCIALGATRRDLVVSSIVAVDPDGSARRCGQRRRRRRREHARPDRHRPAGTVDTRRLGRPGRAGRRASRPSSRS